jgi:hypothetical protein
MQTSDVRRHVREAIERSKRAAADRRARGDEAARDYEAFLASTAVPLFQQIAGALRAERHMFTVFTPTASVRLMSDRSRADYIELVLDSSGPLPQVLGRTSRSRGRRVIEAEAPIAPGLEVRALTEEHVLAFVLRELESLIER